MAQTGNTKAIAQRYRYIAKDLDGALHRGEATAEDRDQLYQQLLAQNLYLQSAHPATKGKRKLLKDNVISEFCRQLSTLLGAGVNLARALQIIANEEGLNPNLKAIYEEILSDIRKGIPLSVSMESTEVFPELLLGMIRAGEATGSLDRVTDRMATHYQKQHQLNSSVKSAMTYPMILAVMAVLVVVVIVTFVLPQFEDLFDMMEELPWATQVLMNFSEFLLSKWYLIILGLACLVVLIRVILSVPKVRTAVDKFKLKMPVFGRLNRVTCTARFARTLSSLYSSGVPIVAALQTARSTVGNAYIAGQFDAVLDSIRGGSNLSEALALVDGFVLKLSSTVQIGEETGKMDDMLNSVADAMEYDAEQASKRMLTLLEPMLIVVMALVVGFIMIAVMGPIISSYGAIEGSAY